MEFYHLVVTTCVLFSLALAGETQAHALSPEEDYWHAVWPNTPIPNPLRELLKSGPAAINDLPMQIDDTQYPRTFFIPQELYPGKTMNVHFDKFPLTQPYGVWGWASRIKDIEKEGYTYADVCINQKPNRLEDKHCAKSLGTLVGFAISKLGKNIQALSSSFISKEGKYTVEGVQNLGTKAVMCHRLNFQKVIFYCHEIKETTAYMVPLVASDGTKTHALAVCHADTSAMNPHVLHDMLNFYPGTNPACHFLGNKAVLWVPILAMDNAYGNNVAV